ncbi:hypothetical protein [Sessilibacter sp. MAH2]
MKKISLSRYSVGVFTVFDRVFGGLLSVRFYEVISLLSNLEDIRLKARVGIKAHDLARANSVT